VRLGASVVGLLQYMAKVNHDIAGLFFGGVASLLWFIDALSIFGPPAAACTITLPASRW